MGMWRSRVGEVSLLGDWRTVSIWQALGSLVEHTCNLECGGTGVPITD
jgi:hypothetical protein